MRIQCPGCRRTVPAGNINVATDLGQCPECHEVFRVSEAAAVSGEEIREVVLNPPSGAWYRKDMDATVVGVSTRSPVAFFLVPFMCVWSGGSLGGIYGTQIVSGKFNPVMSLFGIPFLLGSLFFWSLALMAICGKVEVSISRGEAVVFTGVGSVGLRRRVKWSEVRRITETAPAYRQPGGLVLEGKSRLKFASGVSEPRRYFLMTTLRSLLTAGSSRSR